MSQPNAPDVLPPVGPSGSAALNRPLTSPGSSTGAASTRPIVETAELPAPGASAVPSVAPAATPEVVAADVVVAALSPAPPPSPPATIGAKLKASKARDLIKRSQSKLLKTPQILKTATRGGAESPTAEGDAGAASDAGKGASDAEAEEGEEEEEEQEKDDDGNEDEESGAKDD